MAPERTPPPPGSMTVPLLFGWQEIAIVLALLVALGVAFLAVATARAGTGERSEWQAWLDARSGSHEDPAGDPHGRPAPGQPAVVDRHARTSRLRNT